MTDTIDVLLDEAQSLAGGGRLEEAIDLLADANRSAPDHRVEQRILELRHVAADGVLAAATPAPWPRPAPDRFPSGEIPEVAVDDLDSDTIASALQNHGSLLVRGLVDPERAAALRDTIDRAFDGAARVREEPGADVGPDLVPFQPAEKYPFGIYERAFANFGSGVLGVDSPRAMFQMTDALEAAGVRSIFTEYFDERPVFSVKKTTLRRTEPGSLAGWHQDGAFLGTETRALNVWTALSPCGVEAPSLDVFADSFDHLVPTGGPEIYDWSVSDETAESYDTSKIVRPVFDTGDALLFDHMTLHRTGVDPSMTKTRYAIEMWFFAPSTYPMEQIPICF